jgi:hypothetical protein
MHGGVGEYIVLVGNVKGRKQLGDLGVDVKIILKWMLTVGFEDVDWIHFVQDRL